MKAISLKIDGIRLLWLSALGMLIVLLILPGFVRKENWDHLILVAPVAANTARLSGDQLEKRNGDPLLISYEIESEVSVKTLNNSSSVILNATNASYPFLTGYQMVSGSFFTEKDQKEKRRLAVLNRTAAVNLFGSTDICGNELTLKREHFTVIGVIEDSGGIKSTEPVARIYIPVSAADEKDPASFLMKAEQAGDEIQAKYLYKSLTESEGSYTFFSFHKIMGLLGELMITALRISCTGICVLLLKRISREWMSDLEELKALFAHQYLRELMRMQRRFLSKLAGKSFLMASAALLILFQFLGMIQTVTKWKETEVLGRIFDTSPLGCYAQQLQHIAVLMMILISFLFMNLLILFVRAKK
ncbi:ABC transporter permease [Anoxybacterium hadale]|uniref:ABC transporter permease n=1 Tax=Anoxybacterium hadale TaxID=3408580 RepID=A0ACD1AAE1_9FIRM|nr:ABC transporter permease [Clostridiales bacterium]